MVSFNHSCSDDKSNIHEKSEVFSAEKPLKCPIDKLIDGVQFVGRHAGEVTELSMRQ